MLRKAIQKFIVVVQKIVITLALFLLYVFGLGATALLAAVFCPRLLRPRRSRGTFWEEAEGYSPDAGDCLMGS